MSTSIEQRVVQMRFDNKQFEAGAKESMSTLEKLKEKLNFSGAAKGLTELGRATEQVSLDTLGKDVDSISVKFDALAVVAITALTRITNSAIDTGSRLVKSLSTDQVTEGFNKYEQKVQSVQTIMNATGKSIEEVEYELSKLIWFTDETSYSFSDMVENVGKFTSNQIDLTVAVRSMMGIADAAGLAGASVNDASHAMQGFSKAMAEGYMTRQNWTWIQTAHMDTAAFKEQLIEAAEAAGTLIKVSDGVWQTLKGETVTIGNFETGMKDAWLSTDVMLKALERFGGSAEELFNYVEEHGGLASDAIDAIGDSLDEIGIKAFKASQEAKTFSDAINATKDAVSTGWMETFDILFGNYEEAKELWTGLTEELYDIFAAGAEGRNDILREWKEAGGRDTLLEGLVEAWTAVKEVVEAVKKAISTVFPVDWVRVLKNVSNAVLEFGKNLHLSEDALTTLGEIVKAILIPFNILFQVLRVGLTVVTNVIAILWSLADVLLALPTKLGGVRGILEKIFGEERYSRLAAAFSKIVSGLASAFGTLVTAVASVVTGFKGLGNSKIGEVFERLINILTPIAEWILDRIVDGIEKIANFDYSRISDWAAIALTFVVDRLEDVRDMSSSAIGAVIAFFQQFDKVHPVDFFNSLIEAVLKLKTTIKTTIKGLGVKTITESIKEETSGITEIIHGLAGALEGLIKKLTPAKILVFGFGVTLTSVLMNVSKAFEAFGGVASSISGAFKSVTGIFNAIQDRIKPNKFQKIAAAILLLAGAMVAMSLVNPYKLQQATKAMVVLMAGLTIMVGAFAAIEKVLLKGDDFGKMLREMSVLMLGIASAVIILSGAMLLLQNLNVTQVIGPLSLVLTTMLGLSLTISILAKYTKGELPKNALTLVAFAVAIKIVVGALQDLANADLSGIIDNIGGLIIATTLLGVLALAAGKVSFKTGLGVTVLILDLLLFAKALEAIGKVQPESLIKGIMGYMAIMTALVPLFWLSSLAGKEAFKMGLAMLTMVAAIGLLKFAISSIGSIPLGDLAKGTAAVVALLAMFGLLNKMSAVAEGKKVEGLGKSFLAMAAAILLLGVAIDYIGHLDLAVAVQGTVVVSALLALFALITKQAAGIEKATGTIVAMVSAIGILTAAVMLLTLLPFGETLTAAITLSAVMLAFGASMKLIQGVDLKSALVSVGMLLATTFAVVRVLRALNELNTDDMLEKATSFGIVIAALGASLGVMNLHSGSWGDVAKTAVIMGAALAEVLAVIWALNAIPLNEGMLVKTVALSGVLLALSMTIDKLKARTGDFGNLLKTIGFMGLFVAEATAVVLALSLIPASEGLLTKTLALAAIMTTLAFTTDKFKARQGNMSGLLKELAFMGLFLAEATAVVGILSLIPVTDGLIEKAAALSLVLLSMSGAIAIVSAISGALVVLGTMGAAAIQGALVAEAIIGTMVSVVLLLGGLFALFPDLEGPLTMAEQMLPRIGAVIGSFFGNIVGGFVGGVASGVTSQLPKMADDLALFAEKIKPFLEIRVEQGVVDAVLRLAEVVALVTGARFIDGIAAFLTGKSSLVKFGEELEKFTPHFRAFADGMDGINVEAVTAAGIAMSGLGSVLATIPTEGGLMTGLLGGQDFSNFSSGLKSFAEAMKTYFDIISTTTITQEQVDATKYATDALVELANKVPKSGGLLQEFFGTADIGLFGRQLLQFGLSLASFFEVISAANIDYELVEACAVAGSSLAAFANKVPAAGGVLQEWFGAQDIGVFGRQLVSFGMALRDFFAIMTAEGVTIDQSVVNACVLAGEAFASFSEKVPQMGGAFEWFTGSKDMGEFGNQIREFGQGLADFFSSFKGAGVTEQDVILSNQVLDGFGKLADTLGENGGIASAWSSTDLEKFGKQIKKLGEHLGSYYSSISSIDLDQVSLSIATAQAFLDLSGALATSGMSIVEAVKSVMDDVIAGAKEILGITGNYSGEFYQIGEHIISGLIKGINDNKGSSTATMKVWGSDVTAAFAGSVGVNSPSTKFAEIGMYIVQGLTNGINKYAVQARNAIIKMGESILSSIQFYFGINSPSTVMRDEVGRYIVQGLAEGITEDMSAEEAATKKAQNIINAFKSEFDKFSLDITTIGLETDLWAAQNPNASEKDIQAKEIEALTKKLQAQAEKVNLANVQYQATLKALGEEAEETQEAYNTFLQEQLTMTQLAQELADANRAIAASGVSTRGMDTTTAELEYQLWEKINTAATEQEIADKKMELLNKQLDLSATKVVQAEQNYKKLLEELGADADATRDAYDEYLQAQITMAGLAGDFAELRGIKNDAIAEQNQERRALFQAFSDYIQENADRLREEGYSADEIRAMAEQATGWSYDTPKATSLDTNVKNIIDEFMKNATLPLEQAVGAVETNVMDIVDMFLKSASNALTGAGEGLEIIFIEPVIEAVENGIDEITSAGVSAATGSSGGSSGGGSGGGAIGSALSSGIGSAFESSVPELTESTMASLGDVMNVLSDEGIDLGSIAGELTSGSFLDKVNERIRSGGDTVVSAVRSVFAKVTGQGIEDAAAGGGQAGHAYTDGTVMAIDDNTIYAMQAAERSMIAAGESGKIAAGEGGNAAGVETTNQYAQGVANTISVSTNAASSMAKDAYNAANSYILANMATVGVNAALGMAKGMKSSEASAAVKSAAAGLSLLAKTTTMKGLDEHSPSRVFFKIGQYIDQGLANGILDEYDIVAGSLKNLTDHISSAGNDAVVRPVVDLGSWNKGVGQVKNDMDEFYRTVLQWDAAGNLVPYGYNNSSPNGGKWIKVDAASAQAIRSGDMQLEARAYELAKKGYAQESDTASAPTYNFYQTNNSPKSISTAEVYRTTKNLLSRTRSAVEVFVNKTTLPSMTNKVNALRG